MNTLANHVQLIGRLGADAEFKTTNQGKRFSTFRMAINQRIRSNEGERKEITQWHTCVVWGGDLNKIVEKFGKKGNQVIISGSLMNRSYSDGAGGQRYTTEIHVSQIFLLNLSRSSEQVQEPEKEVE